MDAKKEIQSYMTIENMEDTIIWGTSGDGVYSPASAFKWLSANNSLPIAQFDKWYVLGLEATTTRKLKIPLLVLNGW